MFLSQSWETSKGSPKFATTWSATQLGLQSSSQMQTLTASLLSKLKSLKFKCRAKVIKVLHSSKSICSSLTLPLTITGSKEKDWAYSSASRSQTNLTEQSATRKLTMVRQIIFSLQCRAKVRRTNLI